MTAPTHKTIDDYLAQIPASTALGIQVVSAQADTVLLRLPMAGNTNHHRSVFGGSLSLVATLAGWACAHGSLPQAQGNIVIKSSQMRYLAPATSDVWVQAVVSTDERQKAQAMTARFGRASLAVTCTLYCLTDDSASCDIQSIARQGKPVASFTGVFVAVLAE